MMRHSVFASSIPTCDEVMEVTARAWGFETPDNGFLHPLYDNGLGWHHSQEASAKEKKLRVSRDRYYERLNRQYIQPFVEQQNTPHVTESPQSPKDMVLYLIAKLTKAASVEGRTFSEAESRAYDFYMGKLKELG